AATVPETAVAVDEALAATLRASVALSVRLMLVPLRLVAFVIVSEAPEASVTAAAEVSDRLSAVLVPVSNVLESSVIATAAVALRSDVRRVAETGRARWRQAADGG